MSITLAIGIFCHVACMIRTWHFLDTNSTKEIASLVRGWREHGCLGIPPPYYWTERLSFNRHLYRIQTVNQRGVATA
ncbi:hypothetical protein DBR19_03155 [Aeromonas sp. HMWF014]|nr:hypothetical protein DBR19_03155 [Aeromonas sp. HMWF014]